MYKKYGTLNTEWQIEFKKGFKECFRVLDNKGVLIFKWSEVKHKVSDILNLIDVEPLFGHQTNKHSIWLSFMKI